MQDRHNALGQLLRLFKFERNAAEAEIKYTGATSALLANDGVGIRTDHGNTFRFSLNRIAGRGFGRSWSLRRKGTRGDGRSIGEIGRSLILRASRRNGDGWRRRGGRRSRGAQPQRVMNCRPYERD